MTELQTSDADSAWIDVQFLKTANDLVFAVKADAKEAPLYAFHFSDFVRIVLHTSDLPLRNTSSVPDGMVMRAMTLADPGSSVVAC